MEPSFSNLPEGLAEVGRDAGFFGDDEDFPHGMVAGFGLREKADGRRLGKGIPESRGQSRLVDEVSGRVGNGGIRDRWIGMESFNPLVHAALPKDRKHPESGFSITAADFCRDSKRVMRPAQDAAGVEAVVHDRFRSGAWRP